MHSFYKHIFTPLIILSFAFPVNSHAQTYCDATSLGAGNIFGGNIESLEVTDDTGLVYGYYGIANNTTEVVLNPNEPFTLSSWEYFTFAIKGSSDTAGSSFWTRAGVWVDLNGDDSFSANECIADPISGPFSHVTRLGWTSALLNIPGTITPGKRRLRIRGFDNKHEITAAMGCGASASYGNQLDLVLNLLVGPMSVKDALTSGVLLYPNPTSGSFSISGLKSETPCRVVVTDMKGAIFLDHLLPAGSSEVNAGHLPDGAYTVQLEQNGKMVHTRLMVTGQ